MSLSAFIVKCTLQILPHAPTDRAGQDALEQIGLDAGVQAAETVLPPHLGHNLRHAWWGIVLGRTELVIVLWAHRLHFGLDQIKRITNRAGSGR